MSNPNMKFRMFVIKTNAPDGTNYFCRPSVVGTEESKRLEIPIGIYNEWDTDINFAMRFDSEVRAKNYLNTVLKLDGCEVEELPHFKVV